MFTLTLETHDPAKKPRPEDRLAIRLLQATNMCYARIWHQVIVRAPHCLPPRGAGVLVCNHTSHIDPFLIQSVLPRLVTWMMTHEFYDMKGMQWFYRTIGAIRVERRGRDVAGVRQALRALQEGGVLGLFPEGRIETSDDFLPLQTGAAAMALKAGVPIYPAFLDGTQRRTTVAQSVFTRQRSLLAFGPALHFQPTDSVESATARIAESLKKLSQLVRSKR